MRIEGIFRRRDWRELTSEGERGREKGVRYAMNMAIEEEYGNVLGFQKWNVF